MKLLILQSKSESRISNAQNVSDSDIRYWYFPAIAGQEGAIGFDREVRVREACRVSTFPQKSGNKHNCRLSRVRISCVEQLHHLDFLPASSPVWCDTSRIVFLDTYTGRQNLIGVGGRKPVSGCSFIREQCAD